MASARAGVQSWIRGLRRQARPGRLSGAERRLCLSGRRRGHAGPRGGHRGDRGGLPVRDRERGGRLPGQRALRLDRGRMPPGPGRPDRRQPGRRHPGPEHDHPDLPARGDPVPRLGARGRGGGVPARPRRERQALGAGRRAPRRRGALGRSRLPDHRAAGRPVRRPDFPADPAGRRDRGQQRRRYQAGRGGYRRGRARGRRAGLRGRRARHPAPARRRRGARRRLLRHQRLQVVGTAHRHRGRRTRLARDPAAGPARARPCGRAGPVRARHRRVRRPGRGRRGGGAPRLARPGPEDRRRQQAAAGAGLDGRPRGVRDATVRADARRPGRDGARDALRPGRAARPDRVLHRGRAHAQAGRGAPGRAPGQHLERRQLRLGTGRGTRPAGLRRRRPGRPGPLQRRGRRRPPAGRGRRTRLAVQGPG